MRILPGVHLVGSGWLGFNVTDRHDCNVFLVRGDDDAVLVDAGCGLAPDLIAANIAAAGIPPETVSRILLTHAHADHAGGAAALASLLGADVWASAGTAAIVEAADENAAGLTAARRAGLYPPAVRLRPVRVRVLDADTEVRVGNVTIEVVATPGHAAGHVCFFTVVAGRRAVFSGDLVFSRGRVAVLATPDTDIAALAASISRVAALNPDVLLPGHGCLVLSEAGVHASAAVDAFAEERLPAALVP